MPPVRGHSCSVTLALSSFGVYLGRFQRWNSWDVFTQPQVFAHNLVPHLAHPQEQPRALAVMVLFTAFLGATYLVVLLVGGYSTTETPDRQT